MGCLTRRKYRTRDGQERTSRRYYIRYRDADGKIVMEVAYTDKRASENLLAQREREAARGERGMRVPCREHRRRPLSEHVEDFIRSLAAGGVGEMHRRHVHQHLDRAFKDMEATRLDDLTTAKVEGHLLALVQAGRSAKTRNHVRNELAQFFAWLIERGRWGRNPVDPIKRLNAEADPKRRRRALTPEELQDLVAAARVRPLAGYIAGNHPNPTAEKRAELELIGLQRATLYMTAAMTGLRRGELKQLRWADLDLNGDPPTVTVRAETAKSRRTDTLPLAAPAVEALREWWAACAEARWEIPKQGDLVFDCIGRQCIDHFRADCRHAGVDLDTAEGRIDFHSLRHSTATMLVNAGVSVRTAQELLRHVDPRTTMRIYAHVQAAERLDAVRRLTALLGQSTEAAAVAQAGGNS